MFKLLNALWNKANDNKHKNTNVANFPFYTTFL